MKNIVISMVAVSVLFLGCSDEKGSPVGQAQAGQMPPLPVKDYVVKFDRADFTKSYSALLKPSQEVEVVARVSGVLVKENFLEGAFVKKGDTLYEIQKEEYDASLEESKASLQKAEANLLKASKDWSRSEYLFKNAAVSEQQRDEVLYAHENAKAEVHKAKASLKNAQLNRDYATIKAPISGIVGLSSSDEGSFISTQNAQLTTITALDPIHAEFSLSSSDATKYLSQIKKSAQASLTLNKKTYKGTIDFIAPKVDAQTDTLHMRAKFENPDGDLLIGSFVEITLGGFSYESVAKIPQNALIKTPDATVVYVIENGAVSMRPVKVAHTDNGVAIVESGLKENEHIVISNIAKLKPNSKVTVMEGK